jgi:putative PIN family toxin of toxin-antitoxin system
MRVVLDTNVLCSALMTPGGLPDQLYLAWRDRLFTLVTSEEQLEEFRQVTRYPRVKQRIDPAAAGTLYNELHQLAVVLRTLPELDVSSDAGDNFLLAMAQGGKTDFLVSGDKRHVLSLKTFGTTQIVTARQMLEKLGRR